MKTHDVRYGRQRNEIVLGQMQSQPEIYSQPLPIVHALRKMNNFRPKSKAISIDASIVFTPLGDAAASRFLAGHKKWTERASNASG